VNECGKIVREQWFESGRIRRELELDAFTVMPNHLHGILWLVGPNGVRPATYGARPGANRNLGSAHGAKHVGPSGARPGANGIRPHELGRTRFDFAHRPELVEGPFGPTNQIPTMRPHSLASWASGFKSAVTSRIRRLWKKPHATVWQEDYFEHIIRDEAELLRIRDYILSNPARWKLDRENPEAGPDVEDEWPWNADDAS